MISKKHLSALLTGVSLAAVGIAQASRAYAGTTLTWCGDVRDDPDFLH